MTGTRPSPSRIRLWAPGARSLLVGVLGLMTCIAFESFAVTTALPVVVRDLSADRWYALAFAATLTTGLIGMTVGGGWADRRGPAQPLFFGGLAFLVGIGMCVTAPGIGVFVLGRMLQGVGGGIDSVVLYVIIARGVPTELRSRVFGLLTAAWLLPSVAGPLLTGILVEVLHWRAVFALVLAGAAASLLVLAGPARRLPSDPAPGRVLDRRVLWSVAAMASVVGLHVAGQRPLPELVVGTALSVVVLVVAARMTPRGTLRARAGIPRWVALRGLLGGTVTVTDVYLALHLQHGLGHSPTLAGLVVAVGAFGWALGAWVQGRHDEDASGRPFPLWPAAVLVLCGPVAALGLVGGVLPLAGVALGCVLMGTGMGIAYPRISSTVLSLSAPDEQGSNSSALQVFDSLSTSALLGVAGAVLSAGLLAGYPGVFALAAGAGCTALVVASALGPAGGAGTRGVPA